jgi:hypothetical protein
VNLLVGHVHGMCRDTFPNLSSEIIGRRWQYSRVRYGSSLLRSADCSGFARRGIELPLGVRCGLIQWLRYAHRIGRTGFCKLRIAGGGHAQLGLGAKLDTLSSWQTRRFDMCGGFFSIGDLENGLRGFKTQHIEIGGRHSCCFF